MRFSTFHFALINTLYQENGCIVQGRFCPAYWNVFPCMLSLFFFLDKNNHQQVNFNLFLFVKALAFLPSSKLKVIFGAFGLSSFSENASWTLKILGNISPLMWIWHKAGSFGYRKAVHTGKMVQRGKALVAKLNRSLVPTLWKRSDSHMLSYDLHMGLCSTHTHTKYYLDI